MDKKEEIRNLQQAELVGLCEKYGVNSEKMLQLVKSEKDKKLLRRRVSILKTIGTIIQEESEK